MFANETVDNSIPKKAQPLTRRDWILLAILVPALIGIQFGVWSWGYAASTRVPLDLQRPGLVQLVGAISSLASATVMYFLALRVPRQWPKSRFLGYVFLAFAFGPVVAATAVARAGGPRIRLTALTTPQLGSYLGLTLAGWRRQVIRSTEFEVPPACPDSSSGFAR